MASLRAESAACREADGCGPEWRPELQPETASYRIHCAFKLKLIARRVDEVLHQRDDRHWTGSARIQGNPACHFLDTIKIDVAGKSSRPDSAKSHINHAGSRLHHIGSDQKRSPDLSSGAGHQQIRLAANTFEISRIAMAPGHRGIAQAPAQNQGGRLTRNVAAANYHCARAVYRNLIVVEQ